MEGTDYLLLSHSAAKNRIIHAATSWCHAFDYPTEKKHVHSASENEPKCCIPHAVEWSKVFIHLIASTFKHWRKGDTHYY